MSVCPVCGGSVFEGLICRTCGFDESRNYEKYPAAAPVSNGKSVAALQKARAEELKEAYLNQLKLVLDAPCYEYDEETGELTYDHSDQITLLSGASLKENEIVWADTEFLRIDGQSTLPVSLTVYNGTGKRVYHLTVNNPNGKDTKGKWKVGVELGTTSDMGAQLVVATADGKRREASESFALKF